MKHTAFDNGSKVIDSRDVIARLEELESDRSALVDALAEEDITEEEKAEREDALTEWEEGYDGEALKVLKALADEASGSPDWTYGETLIRDTYFKDYAQELAEDCGMLKDADTWPGRCIDWEQAADELKQDYFSVDFDGVEYWIRA